MFVILINVSIFRMSTEKKEKFIHFETVLRYLSIRSVFDFSVTFKLTQVDRILLKNIWL